MGIGNRIRMARERMGMTQKELAVLLGVTASAVTNYENNTSHPKEPIMYKLFSALKVDANFLFQDKMNGNTDSITAEQRELIEDYKALDSHGKEMVDVVLEKEHNRTVAKKAKALETKKEPVQKDEPEYIVMRIYNQSAAAGMGNYLVDDCEYDYDECECLVSDIPVDADMGFRISGDSMSPDINDGDIVWVREQHQVDSGDVGIFTIDGNSFCKRLKVDTSSRRAWLVSDNPNYDDIELKEYMNFRTIGLVLGVHNTN